MMKKALSIILTLTLLVSALSNAFAEGETNLAESAEPQIVLAEAAAPTEAPTATPSPTPEPTAAPTPTEAPVTVAAEATSTPAPSIAAEETEPVAQASDSPTPEASSSEALGADASATPAPALFEAGLVTLAKGVTLYAEPTLQTVTGMLTEDGLAYAEPVADNADIVKLTCTLDGETLLNAYAALRDVHAIPADELATYQTQTEGLLYLHFSLYPLHLQAATETVAPTATPESFTEGAVTLAAGTVLYTDEAQTTPLGTLRTAGIAYQLALTVAEADTATAEAAAEQTDTPSATATPAVITLQFTLDNATLQTGYIAATAAPQPVTGEALTAYLQQESSVQVKGVPLFALDVELAQTYEMLTYRLPGMPADYTLTAEELADKALLTSKGILEYLKTAAPNVDYVEGEVLVSADTEAYAQMVAASYAAKVAYVGTDFAVLQLDGFTVAEVVAAAADPLARLVMVEPNHLTRLEPNHTNAGNTKKSTMMLAGALAVPTLKTWADFKTMDPFLSNPGDSSQYTTGTSLSSGYQYMHDMVGTYGAWGLTAGSSEVKVGILDTGFNATHTDLAGQITDITNANGASALTDNFGHGTHVAGIVAAKLGNNAGGSGIAPGVSLLGYSVVTSDGSIPDSLIIDGLEKMIANGAWVISMSLGGAAYSIDLENAVEDCINSGIAVIAAAGNDGGVTNTYPAAYDGVICVGAVDPIGQRAPYSNYGSNITLAAPGSYILSTWTGGSSAYRSISGTSMATPVVAGVAALYYSARGTRDLDGDNEFKAADVAALRSALTGSCKAISGGMGAGIINATNMFKKVVTKPTFSLTVGSSSYTNYTAVPTGAVLHMSAGYNGTYMVYTTNGTTPSVRSGQLVNGTATDGDPAISLADYPSGKVTVKAISVNAQGVASSVGYFSFTVDNKLILPTSISISGPAFLYKGKSATYVATFNPVSSLKATWSIVSGNATVNSSTGYVTLRSDASGTVVVQAAYESLVSSTFTIQVTTSLTKQITPSVASLKLNVGDAPVHWTATALLRDNTTKDFRTEMSSRVTISNAKVATVQEDDTGWVVTPVAKGTATLRLSALDGSGITKYVTVTVRQPVTAIEISGGATACLAAGRSRQLKAVITPSTASSKTVTWESVSLPDKVTLSSTGVLYVPSTAGITEPATAIVKCTSIETPTMSATQTITLYPSPVTAVTLTGTDAKLTTYYGKLQSAILFTVNTDGSIYDPGNNEQQLSLGYVTSGPATDVPVLWATSNAKVATVSQTGLVTAVGPGLATISATAQDGSAKRASLLVRVRIPVANLRIFPSTARVATSYPVLGFGYSAKIYASFGNSYGTPSSTGLTWSYTVYNSDGVTNAAIQQYISTYRMVSLSSSGVLTVRRDPYYKNSSTYDTYYVKVTATTTDGSNRSNAVTYVAQPAITSMQRFSEPSSQTVTVPIYFNNSEAATFYYYTDNAYVDDFTVTSSNPKVAAPYDATGDQVLYQYTGDSIYSYTSGKTYYRMVIYIFGYKLGTATITVKTNDGSNKSLSFYVKVVNP